jgi:RHS repeat-associated protein
MIEYTQNEPGTYYYHFDGSGNVVALTNSSGNTVEVYEYDVYGKVGASDASHPNRFMFTGREFDKETGLYYYRARYYKPEIGRFLQADQVGYTAEMNLYRYCRNNPWNMGDPFGRDPCDSNTVSDPCDPCDPSGCQDLDWNFIQSTLDALDAAVASTSGSSGTGEQTVAPPDFLLPAPGYQKGLREGREIWDHGRKHVDDILGGYYDNPFTNGDAGALHQHYGYYFWFGFGKAEKGAAKDALDKAKGECISRGLGAVCEDAPKVWNIWGKITKVCKFWRWWHKPEQGDNQAQK